MNRNRENLIKFYVSDEEKNIIDEKMKAMEITSISAYMRQMSCNGYIIRTDYSELKKLNQEIHKIGVNINQIAKRINETNRTYQDDINEIQKGVAEIWQLLKFTLSKLHRKKQ